MAVVCEPEVISTERLKEQIQTVLKKEGGDATLQKELKEYIQAERVPFRLVKQVHDVLSLSGDGEKKLYLHEMLEGSSLHIPEYEPLPRVTSVKYNFGKLIIYSKKMETSVKRRQNFRLLQFERCCRQQIKNPELEARCKKLRLEQDNKRYKEMVKNVDKSNKDYFSAGKDVKEMNRQIMSVVNFVVTVLGAFAFGYKATEFTFYGSNVFAMQLGAGLTLATVVFFADLYFLLKESE